MGVGGSQARPSGQILVSGLLPHVWVQLPHQDPASRSLRLPSIIHFPRLAHGADAHTHTTAPKAGEEEQ